MVANLAELHQHVDHRLKQKRSFYREDRLSGRLSTIDLLAKVVTFYEKGKNKFHKLN
jgi:hypothetical protein